MNANGQYPPPPDIGNYLENRAKFPSAELAKFAGQWVAWTPDGTRIVAHGEDMLATARLMEAAGIDPSQFVWSSVPPLNEESVL